MKKNGILIAAGTVITTLLIGWVQHLKAQVSYADFNCPVCGSDEVLDFGDSELGKKCHCYDCKTEFYITENYSDYE